MSMYQEFGLQAVEVSSGPNSYSGALVVELQTGPRGYKGEAGPPGPQGPPGSLTSVHGDLELTADQQGALATVTGLQSHPISTTAPSQNQALIWDGTSWKPETLSAGTY